MPKRWNPYLAHPDRRHVLRGSALTGLGAAVVGAGSARATMPNPVRPRDLPVRKVAERAEAATNAKPADLNGYERVKLELVAPPFAPKHEQVASGASKIVEVYMETQERLMVVDEDTGASIWALTCNGSVPGPLIICHEGDYVELTLRNPVDSVMEHNIDFHASTGALGGGGLTHVYPGEETIQRWKATKAGVSTYHCAPGGEMAAYHVCHGMNRTMMVLPREGLKDKNGNPLLYDNIFYIGEQDYYLPMDADGNHIQYEIAGDDYAESIDTMRTFVPTHSVFSGAVAALTGENALKANVGDTVLMVHNQANRDTRLHLIGGHGDYVWEAGSFTDHPQTGLETWFIRGGSSGAALYRFRQPGVYAYVNQNLIEAVRLGATGHVVVEGQWVNGLTEQVVEPREFNI
ncbi:MAG: copper-containing nitrite reductase [Pseudomonadota bacterium]